jgi:hypothetical protein
MQKAKASYQFTQFIGRFSWLPTDGVHVEYAEQSRLAFVAPTGSRAFKEALGAAPADVQPEWVDWARYP